MATPALANLPQSANVQGFWKLEEATGSGDRVDSSTNGYDLTASASLTRVTGRFNNDYGVDLEADSTDKLTDVDPTNLQITGDLTISFCMKIEALPGEEQILIDQRAAGEAEDANILYRLLLDSNGDIKTLHEYSTGSDEAEQIFTDANLSTGTWYHIVFRRDVSANTWDLTVNDGAKTQLTYTNDPTGGTNTDFRITGDGVMDEVIIWDSKLTNAQITSLYQKMNLENPAFLMNFM